MPISEQLLELSPVYKQKGFKPDLLNSNVHPTLIELHRIMGSRWGFLLRQCVIIADKKLNHIEITQISLTIQCISTGSQSKKEQLVDPGTSLE